MKVGKLAIKIVGMYLAHTDRKARKHWPDPAPYTPLFDVDALGDGVFLHQIDVYHAPKEIRKDRTLFYVHGGAYLFGSRKGGYSFAKFFLDQGYDVVAFDYEPNKGKGGCYDQIQTVAAQIRYVLAHAGELGINKDNLFVLGDSAGGHYALLLAELASDPGFQKEAGIDLGGASFRAAAVFCPVYDLIRATHSPMMRKSGQKYMFGPHYNDDAYHAPLCPKTHFDSLRIPLFLSTCHNDFLQRESLNLKADCESSGKPLTYVFIENDDRRVGHVHNVVATGLPDSIRVNEATIAFFDGLYA